MRRGSARLAFEFRQAFNKDVVIDIVCYRRHGHNEGDDPSFTQPLMYDLIENKRTRPQALHRGLIGRGDITVEEAEQVLRDYQQQLERVFGEVARGGRRSRRTGYASRAELPGQAGAAGGLATAVTREMLKQIADAHVDVPEASPCTPRSCRSCSAAPRRSATGAIDWATGEVLAFGSLLSTGRPVRLTGQDSRRGTFVQRFAAVIDRSPASRTSRCST